MPVNKLFNVHWNKNLSVILILSAICLIQGIFLYYHLKTNDNNSVTVTTKQLSSGQLTESLLNKFRFDKRQETSLFNLFFNDDFFSNNHDPFDEMQTIHQKFFKNMEKMHQSAFVDTWDKWFDDNFTFKGSFDTNTGINFDMKETSDSYVITIDIPNMKKNNLNVDITDKYITINGNFTQKNEVKNTDGIIISRSEVQQNLSKRLTLPPKTDYEKALVESENNLVIITLQKK